MRAIYHVLYVLQTYAFAVKMNINSTKVDAETFLSISVLLSYECLNTMYLLYLHNVHLHHTL